MSFHNLAVVGVSVKLFGNLFGGKIMQSLYAYPRLPGVIELVVITYFIKVMSVIINPYSYGFLLFNAIFSPIFLI